MEWVKRLSARQYQVSLSYVRKSYTEGAESCLNSLPTGAGKSGVITAVYHKEYTWKI
jgi:ERCC4-related helicase